MSDERVSVVSQSLAAPVPVPVPEPGATTPPVSEPGSPLRSDPIAPPETDVSGTPVRRLNYIARHWRGDLSLSVSYWTNAFLGTIAASIVCRSVRSIPSASDGPLVFAITQSLVWAVAITMSMWYLVGVWRSAGKHRARGGR